MKRYYEGKKDNWADLGRATESAIIKIPYIKCRYKTTSSLAKEWMTRLERTGPKGSPCCTPVADGVTK